MVLGGKLEGLDRFHMWVGGWLELTWGIMQWLCSDLACIQGKLVLIPCIDLEPAKALKLSVAGFSFCYFGKILFLHMGSGFYLWGVLACILTLIHNLIPFVMFLCTKGTKKMSYGIWYVDLHILTVVHLVCWLGWTPMFGPRPNKIRSCILLKFWAICFLRWTWLNEKRTRSKGLVVWKWKHVKVVVITWFLGMVRIWDVCMGCILQV